MATETGTIATVTNSTSGTVARDLDPANPVSYTNPSAFNLSVGTRVSFDFVRPPATILSIILSEPPDEGTVITVPVAGFTVAAGQTVTLKNATVNGNVHVFGKLIIKTNSTVKGTVDDHSNGAELLFYNSIIEGRLNFNYSNKKVTVNNGSVGGDVDIRNLKNGVSVDGLTLIGPNKDLEIRNNGLSTILKNVTVNDGNVEIRNNVDVVVDGLSLNGAGRNLEIRNNRGNCSYTNITTL